MKRPSTVLYGAQDPLPPGVVFVSGLQHVGVMSMYLLYPALVAKAANAPPEVASAMVSITLIALALGAVLQVFRVGPFGSGFICQPVPSIVYFVPSILAAKGGGLGLVFGMTTAAGLIELAMSRALRRLRPVFPPEVIGLVILLVGIASAFVGLKLAFGDARAAGPVDPTELLIGFITLGIMIGLNVWGTGALRIGCVLAGMAGGYVASALLGNISQHDIEAIGHVQMIAFPSFSHVSWSFDPAYAIPFLVAAIAATLKVIGNVTTLQKANDADWVRVDMRSVGRGVLADGLSTVVAGLLGGHGLNSSTPAAGLAAATGVHARRVGYSIVGILLVLAFLPKVGAFFYLMPRMVAASALIFSSTFIIVNGIQVMTSRLLDARKTLLIGLALVAGLAVDAQPAILRLIPETWKPVLGTSLVLGTLVGLALNLMFRLGVRRTQSLEVPLGPVEAERIEQFLQKCGENWGARVDVIEHAKFALVQSIETILEGCDPEGPLQVEATFDEFNVDVRVSYKGPLLELPEIRPSNDEIMETEEGHRRLAGYMLRRFADRVSSSHRNGRSTVAFHFDH
jgi:xanthine permease XanP